MFRQPSRSILSLAAGLTLLAAPLAPVWGQAVQRVSFAAGNDNTSVKGTVSGRQYRDYKLRVGAGQTMDVSMITKGGTFNILPPGSRDVAIYNSSVSGQDATSIKTKAGDYTIRVYNMGAAKGSKRATAYQLSIMVM